MGNNFCHVELNTTDVAAAEGFYGKLFDWKIAKYPGMEYLGISTGSKESGGGIQSKQMPEAPTSWLPYVQVKDVKATLAQAQQLGAQIVVPYMSVGDNGAIGVFVDPMGAGLGVYEPAPKAAPKKPAKKKVAAKKAKSKKR
jgi:predicted enzyme related to lactoylglutathione lyase